MSTLHRIYHLARADFYERVRSYQFLVILGLSVFLGYQVAIGNLTLTLGKYRGEFNSAWVGSMVSLVATFFLGWFGFYVVKGAVNRDRVTGVGQIMATTPLTRPLYLVGKWLSNLAVLTTMVVVLALVGIVIQLWQGENTQIDAWAYLAPFLFIVLPVMALVAAMAVLFETIPFLQGGLGNVIYFVIFVGSIPSAIEGLGGQHAALEPFGIGLMQQDMGRVVRAIYPDYLEGFSLGPAEFVAATFKWAGIDWTPEIILVRCAWIGAALLLLAIGALFFDRFDPARTRPRLVKAAAPAPAAEAPVSGAPAPVHLSPLSSPARRDQFLNTLQGELNLLLKGKRWWWYAIAGGLILVGLFSPLDSVRAIALPLAWAWPVLVWSGLGSREIRYNVHQISFSSAFPLGRQLPAQWLAGWIVAILAGSGVLLRLLQAGDSTGLLAFASGALFIPSLALACGVWSGNNKLFEIVYMVILYIGPLNHAPALDFCGSSSSGRPEFYIPLSLALIAAAVWGRARQVRN